MPTTELDLAAFEDDPYPIYAELRGNSPVVWLRQLERWLVTRWDDCRAVAGDPTTFSAPQDPALARVVGPQSILATDGEIHRDLRSFVDPQLRPRAVNEYVEELVRPIARRCLERIKPSGSAELMSDYFEPVSVRAVGDLLGLGEVDSETLRRWFHGLASGMTNLSLDPAGFVVCDEVAVEIRSVVDPMLERLVREPDASGLSHWLHDGMPAGQTRSAEYIYPTLLVILTGGLQEPGHGAGNALLGLASAPEQLAAVKADLSLCARTVIEGLRWLPPIGVTFRKAARDAQMSDGTTIARDQGVLVALGSANRDETKFSDPDRFDITRSQTNHIGFGLGDHLCSGHFFARHLERIALEELLGVLPDLELIGTPEDAVSGWVFRTVRTLLAEW